MQLESNVDVGVLASLLPIANAEGLFFNRLEMRCSLNAARITTPLAV